MPTKKSADPPLYKQYAKAVFAGIMAFLSSLGIVLVGDLDLGDITAGQWIAAVLAGMATGGGVAGITNAKPSAESGTA